MCHGYPERLITSLFDMRRSNNYHKNTVLSFHCYWILCFVQCIETFYKMWCFVNILMNSLGKRSSRPHLKIFVRPVFKVLHFCFVRLPHAASALIRELPLLILHPKQYLKNCHITYIFQILFFKVSFSIYWCESDMSNSM